MTLRPTLAATMLTLMLSSAAHAQTDAVFHATTLQLSAAGVVRIKPDMAVVNLGVTTEAPTAQAAMQQNAAKMNAVIAAVRASGVAEKDVQTSGLTLSAQYRYANNQPPERTGYQAVNVVRVSVRDMARVGPILDSAVSAGANDVRGVSFDLADRTPAENAAREAAVRALQAKADLYAHATGYRVLRLVSLGEGDASGPSPRFGLNEVVVTAARAPGVPVNGGELTVDETVNGVFELGR